LLFFSYPNNIDLIRKGRTEVNVSVRRLVLVKLYGKLFVKIIRNKGTAVAQWLRFCATNRKVAGSIPDGVIGFFL
jgi:hypothetical protein